MTQAKHAARVMGGRGMAMWEVHAQVECAERYEVIPGATKLTFPRGLWLIFPPWEYTWKRGDMLHLRGGGPSFNLEVQINDTPPASFPYKVLVDARSPYFEFHDGNDWSDLAERLA